LGHINLALTKKGQDYSGSGQQAIKENLKRFALVALCLLFSFFFYLLVATAIKQEGTVRASLVFLTAILALLIAQWAGATFFETFNPELFGVFFPEHSDYRHAVTVFWQPSPYGQASPLERSGAVA
jgi:hypothetical protein